MHVGISCIFLLILVILSWVVDKEVVQQAIKNSILIEEEQVECRPEKIPDSIADENVDICLVRRYFSCDAWLVLENVLQQKQKMIWTCALIFILKHQLSVICLLWYHFSCVALKKQPKGKVWFCRQCHLSAEH